MELQNLQMMKRNCCVTEYRTKVVKRSYTILFLALIGCRPEQAKSPEFDHSALVASISYKAPAFVDDDRVEQIKKMGQAEHGVIDVYFALNPERNPKIQDLNATFEQNLTRQ